MSGTCTTALLPPHVLPCSALHHPLPGTSLHTEAGPIHFAIKVSPSSRPAHKRLQQPCIVYLACGFAPFGPPARQRAAERPAQPPPRGQAGRLRACAAALHRGGHQEPGGGHGEHTPVLAVTPPTGTCSTLSCSLVPIGMQPPAMPRSHCLSRPCVQVPHSWCCMSLA